MSKLSPVALARAAAPTANAASAAVDVSDYTGAAKLVLDAAQAPTGQTLDVKLQHCDTVGGTYTDAGFSFTQVTNAAASYQVQDISVDGLKKFVKVVSTIAGGSAAHAHQVTLVGNKAL